MELNSVLAQLGGPAVAAVILTSVIKRAAKMPARFLPLLAVLSGFAVSLLIAFGTGALGPSAYLAAFFAGLSAVGAYETATRTTNR